MTTLNASSGYLVLINTFKVDPSNTDKLLKILSQATEDEMRHMSGFVSANLHVSRDRKHIANYAQWRSQEDIDAMMRNPAARKHMQQAAEVATSFEPIYYDLQEVHGATSK